MTDATEHRVANMRAIMVAELLRMGYSVADVAAALKHTDEGDLEGALRILTKWGCRRA